MNMKVSSGFGWYPYDMNPPGISSVENGMPDALKISRTARVVGLSGPRILIPQNSVATYTRSPMFKSQWVLSPTKYLPISYARYADSWSPIRYERTILRGTEDGTAAIADLSLAMVSESNSRHAICFSSARFLAFSSSVCFPRSWACSSASEASFSNKEIYDLLSFRSAVSAPWAKNVSNTSAAIAPVTIIPPTRALIRSGLYWCKSNLSNSGQYYKIRPITTIAVAQISGNLYQSRDISSLDIALNNADLSIEDYERIKWGCIFTIIFVALTMRIALPLYALLRSYRQWRSMRRPR